MTVRKIACRACHGTGMLSDDEGWQYTCSVCHGNGIENRVASNRNVRIMEVDENNRLLD
ncbi:hypothetical protein [Ornithinibacillus gellani]|uniref:hypothetical protein n=1 Tax=Ornithinibacillus gellani TaxID=2293253 RepID=UPI0016813FC3|nr:hypothetical protein [Ornithinibacillus gellani]